MTIARGALDVTIEAEPPFVEQDGNKLSRNIVRKEFSGDMVGTSEAQMVAAYTGTPGSSGETTVSQESWPSGMSRRFWNPSTPV